MIDIRVYHPQTSDKSPQSKNGLCYECATTNIETALEEAMRANRNRP